MLLRALSAPVEKSFNITGSPATWNYLRLGNDIADAEWRTGLHIRPLAVVFHATQVPLYWSTPVTDVLDFTVHLSFVDFHPVSFMGDVLSVTDLQI